MTALQIEEQKAFTENLFIGELFDVFWCGRRPCYVQQLFDRWPGAPGLLFRGGIGASENRGVFRWKVLKPFCYSLIRGKRLPESFRIVFLLPPEETARFVAAHGAGLAAEQVQGLYLNVQYENHGLTCITGVSLNVFSMDRTLEREWDQAVREFLKKNGVAAAEA